MNGPQLRGERAQLLIVNEKKEELYYNNGWNVCR